MAGVISRLIILSFLIFSSSCYLCFSFPSSENSPNTESFTSQPQGYWTFDNMRAFMVDFARRLRLDPLLADTWYTIPFTAVYNTKVSNSSSLNSFSFLPPTVFPPPSPSPTSLHVITQTETRTSPRRHLVLFPSTALPSLHSPPSLQPRP